MSQCVRIFGRQRYDKILASCPSFSPLQVISCGERVHTQRGSVHRLLHRPRRSMGG